MDSRIYFISNYDNQVHNINDVEHQIINENTAEIGIKNEEGGLKVTDTVNLHTIVEVVDYFK